MIGNDWKFGIIDESKKSRYNNYLIVKIGKKTHGDKGLYWFDNCSMQSLCNYLITTGKVAIYHMIIKLINIAYITYTCISVDFVQLCSKSSNY